MSATLKEIIDYIDPNLSRDATAILRREFQQLPIELRQESGRIGRCKTYENPEKIANYLIETIDRTTMKGRRIRKIISNQG